MGIFTKAENQQAYLKCGLLGFAGSGKTFTSALIAKGIHERLKSDKPVYFMDTETGSDFLVPRFKQWNIPMFVSKSRSFVDLIQGTKEAEKNGSILIIDSITHFWQEVQDSYKKANNTRRLMFHHWAFIKDQWRQFTDLYLNSKIHIIMCGRAGFEYDYFQDEDGVKQLEKTGTKMKAETDMGYEPSLLVEMVRETIENKDDSVEAKLWNHTAKVLKDRTAILEGQQCVNPDFKFFEPVFDFLNIGGEHLGIRTDRTSEEIFEQGSDKNMQTLRIKREIFLEKIQGDLTKDISAKSTRLLLLDKAFHTTSWTEIENMSLDTLTKGYATLTKEIQTTINENGRKK